MTQANAEPKSTCHVVVLPYPGRGHINPMMSLCRRLSLRTPLMAITFVVTEEWLGIASEPKPENIHFATIPNVLPSELIRGSKMGEFIKAIMTKIEKPFEQILDRLTVPPAIVLADVFLSWAVDVGERRNVPVALLWPMPDLHNISQTVTTRTLGPYGGDDFVNDIPGLLPIKVSDLPSTLQENDQQRPLLFTVISKVIKAKYLLFTSILELEAPVFEALNPTFPFPIYSLGPLIPNSDFQKISPSSYSEYLKWLDSQSKRSLLYISLGSYLSVSSSQMNEIVLGLYDSGVKFLLASRDKVLTLEREDLLGKTGMVVPWCDQMKVLCHVSIGGFCTHCGWNSTMESAFAGVPMICFPLVMDQSPISKIMAEDWKIGWKVKGGESGRERLVSRDEISELVKRFMDPHNEERKEMLKRAIKIRDVCRAAIQEGGSSGKNIDSFICDINGGEA